MTAIEQADELQRQAIALLLAERQQIDDRLAQLGHGDKKSPVARRGRPPKQPETSFHSETAQPVLPLTHSDRASNTAGFSSERS
jgi:hypothetical protein